MRKSLTLILIAMLASLVVQAAWAEEVSDLVPNSKLASDIMLLKGWNYENGIGAEQDFDKAISCYETVKKYHDSVGESEKSKTIEWMIERARKHQRGDYSDIAQKAHEEMRKISNEQIRKKAAWDNAWIAVVIVVGIVAIQKVIRELNS